MLDLTSSLVREGNTIKHKKEKALTANKIFCKTFFFSFDGPPTMTDPQRYSLHAPAFRRGKHHCSGLL